MADDTKLGSEPHRTPATGAVGVGDHDDVRRPNSLNEPDDELRATAAARTSDRIEAEAENGCGIACTFANEKLAAGP